MNDQELLEVCVDRLNYNLDTGVMIWIKALSNRIKVGDIAGSKHPDGYLRIRINSKAYLVHRLAYLMVYGHLPQYIDHINRDPSDNSIGNLRKCTMTENNQNGGVRKNNISGYKGVSRNRNLWRAEIKYNKKRIHIGYFHCKHEAAKSYNEAALKYHGRFAVFNEVPIG